jgi:hypothetical protein
VKSFSQDLAEDREFEIGGEVFRWRYPHWEETAAIYDEDLELLKEIEGQTNGDGPTTKQAVAMTQKRIQIFIDPAQDAIKRFQALTKRKTDPVPLFQYGELYRWLLEVTSGRPTNQPSDSEPGAGTTEASSADASSSTEGKPRR